jgi:hypothetical protein
MGWTPDRWRAPVVEWLERPVPLWPRPCRVMVCGVGSGVP